MNIPLTREPAISAGNSAADGDPHGGTVAYVVMANIAAIGIRDTGSAVNIHGIVSASAGGTKPVVQTRGAVFQRNVFRKFQYESFPVSGTGLQTYAAFSIITRSFLSHYVVIPKSFSALRWKIFS